MEIVTIRELRQNWPSVEKRLVAAGELTITRDGEVVAELRRPARRSVASARQFDPDAHMKKLKKFWGKRKLAFTSEQLIAAERAERNFSSRP